MSARRCYKCSETRDVRPYGPCGEFVCFRCAFATPEAKAATERSYAQQLDACGASALLTNNGPVPRDREALS